MLQLNSEQAAALQAIKLDRDVARLSAALAAAFPEVRTRLADRYSALVAHGVQRGAAHGLDHGACVARYLACWFILGASFESRPECSWARDILAAPGRPQGSKVFQLCRRTREELTRQLADTPSPAAFDLALGSLDAALMPRGHLGSLLPAVPMPMGEACDLDAIDLRLVEAAGGRQSHLYRLESGQWRRLPTTAPRTSITLTAGAETVPRQPPLMLPARLHLLSPFAEPGCARLRLRTRSGRCCDAQVHPLVTLSGPEGSTSWRGAHAADVLLDLHPEPEPPPADDAPQPTLAVESNPRFAELGIGSCGLRESGQAMGDLQTLLAVYPRTQHWIHWRREAAPALQWPEAAATPPVTRPAMCRVERDGLPLEASRWQAGLEDLDRQLVEGLGRLATAWERDSGVVRGRMQCEPAVLSGTAGLTWGWAEGADGMVDTPHFRLAGHLDLVACQLNLRLGGELVVGGSLSRLSLHCSARTFLRTAFERGPGDTDAQAVVQPAQTAFRHPFVLQLESIAPAESVALLGLGGPVAGALVGQCGLRPRAGAPGLQWFCKLSIEPVTAALRLYDPLLGLQTFARSLLPTLDLLDWSLG